MAAQSTPPTQVPAGYDRHAADDERGYGWVVFAGTLLLMLGTLNFIEGLAAIGNAHFFTANANYIAGSTFSRGSQTSSRRTPRRRHMRQSWNSLWTSTRMWKGSSRN